MPMFPRNLIVFIFWLSLLTSPQAWANRWALVIGNADYEHDKPLANPIRDSQLLQQSLEQIDFKVIPVKNSNRQQMTEVLRSFGDKVQPGDVALIYYSGHGLQHDNDAFLVPVDANIVRANEIPYQAISSSQVLSYLEQASTKILILDACRNNPFATGSKGMGKGLRREVENKSSSTLIAFAAAPNEEAQDGNGSHSPYAQALAQALVQPGKSVEDVFKLVRKQVREETRNQQEPWYNASLEEPLYLAGLVHYVPPEPKQKAETSSDPNQAEIVFWESIKNKSDPVYFQTYLKKYPQGIYQDIARLNATSKFGSTSSKTQEVSSVTSTLAITAPLPESTSQFYTLGDSGPGGGIVFYLDNTGRHGLEAQEEDEPRILFWTEAYVAAKAHGSGWYLPSKDDLNLLFQKKDVVGGFEGVSENYYWSSTEYSKFFAWGQIFSSGIQNFYDKDSPRLVRAVRAF